MFNKNHLSPFVLVAAAVFLGASSQSYAVAHRTDSDSGANNQHCPGCATTTFVGTLSGGPIWSASGGNNETFYLQPEVQKTYTATRNTKANATGELFLGVQTMLDQGFRGQLGLALAVAGTSIQGNIWDDADPVFNNYTYQYNIKNTRYSVKTKLLADIPYGFIGYASGSAGVARNSARSFTITPLIEEAVAAPNFTNNTEMSFSYTLGAGIEYPLGEHLQAGIGYEFANWGKTALSRAPGQSVNDGLGVSHFYTNELLFSISLII